MTARRFSLVDSHLGDDGSTGAGVVAVVRRRGATRFEVGCFLVDPACLGVRDASYEEIDESELADFKERLFPNSCVEKEAAWGRKFVEGAVAYAQRLGFKPHRDYKKAARVFGGTNVQDCGEEFVYGVDGKPFYIASPSDSMEKARAIIRHLEVRCGEGNFDFLMEIKEDPVHVQVEEILQRGVDGSPRAAMEELRRLLKQYPESAMIYFGLGALSGMVDDNRRALAYLDEAIRLSPEMPEAWYNKGIAHKKLLETVPMTVSLQKALEFADPDHEFIENARELVEMIRTMAREEFGLDLETYLAAGEIFDCGFQKMREKRWLEAIAELRRVIEMNPRSYQAFGNIGTSLIQLGRVTEAREALQAALRVKPDYEIAKRNLQSLEGYDDENPPPAMFMFEANVSPETLM